MNSFFNPFYEFQGSWEEMKKLLKGMNKKLRKELINMANSQGINVGLYSETNKCKLYFVTIFYPCKKYLVLVEFLECKNYSILVFDSLEERKKFIQERKEVILRK
jgi:hypothetical protein